MFWQQCSVIHDAGRINHIAGATYVQIVTRETGNPHEKSNFDSGAATVDYSPFQSLKNVKEAERV